MHEDGRDEDARAIFIARLGMFATEAETTKMRPISVPAVPPTST